MSVTSGDTGGTKADGGRRFEDLPPAAQRALQEAEERRLATAPTDRPREIHGRKGPEPARYGDWENKGIVSDF